MQSKQNTLSLNEQFALEKGRAPKGANPLRKNQSCSMTVVVSRSLSPERTRESEN